MTVPSVIQHHEGGNQPRVADLSMHGYSYGIFDNGHWANWRQPDDPRGPGYHDFATDGFNGKVCSVVLTGDRDVYPVTDLDRQAMREIAAHARSKGYITAAPGVFAHRQMPPPNATVCAGFHVGPAVPAKNLDGDNLTWLSVVGCYHLEAPPMPPAKEPTMWPAVDDTVDAAPFGPNNEFVVIVTADGHVYCPKGGYHGSPWNADGTAKAYWKLPDGTVRGAATVVGRPDGYVITSTNNEPYGPNYDV